MVNYAVPQGPDPGNPEAGDNSLLPRTCGRVLPDHLQHFSLIPWVFITGHIQQTVRPALLATFRKFSLPDLYILAKFNTTGI